MSDSIDARLAAARAAERTHRAFDRRVIVGAIAACATVLAPWLLGRWVLRDTFFRAPTGLDPRVREDAAYFFSDWLMGCAVVLLAAGALLIVRPWRAGLGRVVTGAVFVTAGIVLISTSTGSWSSAEARSAELMRTSAYPFSDRFYSCGSQSVTINGALWQAHLARVGASTGSFLQSDCDRVVIFEGWTERGHTDVDIAGGEKINSMTLADDGTVTIATRSGNNPQTFPITQPPVPVGY